MLTNVLAALRAALAIKPEGDEEPRAEGLELVDELEPGLHLAPDHESASAIAKVGAWAGRADITNEKAIARTVRAAKFLGLRRLDIICNDHAGARDPIPFDTYSPGDIVRAARAAQAAGLDVHLMSWIMPHASYLEAAVTRMRELVIMTGAESVQWDAEEPWTQAREPMDYRAAARLVGDSLAGIPMGVNGIGYTPAEKFGPLAEVCDYLVPQCYATATSKLSPVDVVPKLVARYRRLFGAGKRIVVGLAAFRQPPAGYTVESGMRTAFAGAELDAGVDEVVYWSLGWIRKSAAVTRAVRAIASPPPLVA